MTIQEAEQRITSLWEKNRGSAEEEILGLHESAEKLHQSFVNKDAARIDKGVANALIGVLSIAKSLGIKNLEEIFEKRVVDLEKKLK